MSTTYTFYQNQHHFVNLPYRLFYYKYRKQLFEPYYLKLTIISYKNVMWDMMFSIDDSDKEIKKTKFKKKCNI